MLSRGLKVGRSAMSPLHSWGSPTKGNKIRIGHLNGAFSRAQKWAEVLPHTCILGGPQQRGTKSELVASAMPSGGAKSKRMCYVNPAFTAVAKLESKISIGCLSHAFSGVEKWAKVLRHSCINGGPQQRGAQSELAASDMPSRGLKSGGKCYVTLAFSGVTNKGEQKQNWLPQPCLPEGPKVGGSAPTTLHSRGSPTKRTKIRIGSLSHAFSGAQKWAELLRHPAFSGGQNNGEQNRNWLPQPCLFGGLKVGRSAIEAVPRTPWLG